MRLPYIRSSLPFIFFVLTWITPSLSQAEHACKFYRASDHSYLGEVIQGTGKDFNTLFIKKSVGNPKNQIDVEESLIPFFRPLKGSRFSVDGKFQIQKFWVEDAYRIRQDRFIHLPADNLSPLQKSFEELNRDLMEKSDIAGPADFFDNGKFLETLNGTSINEKNEVMTVAGKSNYRFSMVSAISSLDQRDPNGLSLYDYPTMMKIGYVYNDSKDKGLEKGKLRLFSDHSPFSRHRSFKFEEGDQVFENFVVFLRPSREIAVIPAVKVESGKESLCDGELDATYSLPTQLLSVLRGMITEMTFTSIEAGILVADEISNVKNYIDTVQLDQNSEEYISNSALILELTRALSGSEEIQKKIPNGTQDKAVLDAIRDIAALPYHQKLEDILKPGSKKNKKNVSVENYAKMYFEFLASVEADSVKK